MTDGDESNAFDQPAGDPVGDVAEEAAKLWGALQDWARTSGQDQAGAAQGLVEGWAALGDHVGHGQDCGYCPLCIAINRLRRTSPEVKDHLASAIGSLAQAATVALRQHGRQSPADEQPSAPTKVDLDD